jgi:vancomycin permeability regulator SanA
VKAEKKMLAALLAAVAIGVATANVVVLRSEAAIESGPADCALVLGAGVLPDGRPSDVLRDRLDEALAVWREGRVRRILVSGDHQRPGYDEPNAMRRYLEARGVPSEAIFMDHAGLDTYSSVWRARNVFGVERVVVVTQRFHLARAMWLSRALGLEAEGRAADRRLYRGMVWLELREIASRTKAVLDVELGRAPRHAGPRIPLDGDGRGTAG